MLPIPTWNCALTFAASAVVLLLGLGTANASIVALGSTGFLLLSSALAVTLPLSRRARRERLEFAWWLGPASKTTGVVADTPFAVHCFARNHAARDRAIRDLRPIAASEVELANAEDAVVLPSRSKAEFKLQLIARAAGRVVLHGMAARLVGPLGLFETPLYFPNPLALRVLARPSGTAPLARSLVAGAHVERSTFRSLRQRGRGTELYELRDLVPGDPFRSIAWKASARLGRLLVREVEREVQRLSWFVLDASGTMRGGLHGGRPIDRAVEIVASEALAGLRAGDRVGLLAVDERIVVQVKPRDGMAQLLHIQEGLFDALEATDADRTEVDFDDLCALVARYLRAQQGVEFRSAGGLRIAALVRHVEALVANERGARRAGHDSTADSVLRSFCRLRGIPLPARADPVRKSAAFAEALQRLVHRARQPMELVLVTDLERFTPFETLRAGLEKTRRGGHRVTLVVPANAAPAEPRSPGLVNDLRTIFDLHNARRMANARHELAPLGISVLEGVGRRELKVA